LVDKQGDQIGRNFASWVSVYFGKVLEKLEQWSIFLGYLFKEQKLCINFGKMSWATFWVIFLQTHLVTLLTSSGSTVAFFSYYGGTAQWPSNPPEMKTRV
jgi:hypothetical protein